MWIFFFALSSLAFAEKQFVIPEGHNSAKLTQDERRLRLSWGIVQRELRVSECNKPIIDFYLKPFVRGKDHWLMQKRLQAFDHLVLADQMICKGRQPASEVATTESAKAEVGPSIDERISHGHAKELMDACINSICASSSGKFPDLDERFSRNYTLQHDPKLHAQFDQTILPAINAMMAAQERARNRGLDRVIAALEHGAPLSKAETLEAANQVVQSLVNDYRTETKLEAGNIEYSHIIGNKLTHPPPDVELSLLGDLDPITKQFSPKQESEVIAYLEASNKQGALIVDGLNKQFKFNELEHMTPGPALARIGQQSALAILREQARQRHAGLDPDRYAKTGDQIALKKLASGGDYSLRSPQMLESAKNDLANSMLNSGVPDLNRQAEALWGTLRKDPKLNALVLEKFKAERKRPLMTEYMNGKVDICRASYAAQVGSAPTPEQMGVGKSTAERARSAVIQNVLPHYSPTSRKRLTTLVKSLEFVLPTSQSQTKADFLAQVQSYATRTPGLLMDENPLEHFCFAEADDSRALRDETEGQNNKVLVSSESVLYPEFGARVLAHEIGHQISSEFQRKTLSGESLKAYQAARACLASQHDFEAKQITPSKYVEEDGADLNADHAITDTSAETWCSAQGKTHNYELQSSPDDSHSNMLFRLLHNHRVAAGSLPSSCIESLKAANVDLTFTDCFQSVKK